MPSSSKLRRRAKRRPRLTQVGGEWLRTPQRSKALRFGIIGTILVHLLLIWLGPKFQSNFMAGSQLASTAPDPARQFDIEISSPVEDLPPTKFVDVNPDAPDNVPDETDHFAAQNQQLAQEEPALEEGDMPSTVGDDDVESTSIVSGDDAPPVLPTVAPPPTPEADPTQTTPDAPEELPALAQDPLSGTEKLVGDAEDSFGTNVVKLPENPQADVDAPIEGVRDPEQASPEGKGIYYRPNPTRPSVRPNLAQFQDKPAIFSNRVEGTQNIGAVAHDALKTTFGVYFERMLEVIRETWNADVQSKIERRHGYPLAGSRVVVAFQLRKDGSISIENVDGNAGLLWNGVAVEAVAAPARIDKGFGAWPDDMRVVLGDSTPIRLTFYYPR